MKIISVSKVVFLTIITLGIYAIFWAARNRDYLSKHDKKVGYLPKWGWLVTIPVAGILLVGVIIVSLILATLNFISIDASLIALNVSIIAFLVYVTGIGAWWVWHFGTAMEKVTHVLYIFIGPLLAAFYQYFINVDAAEKSTAKHVPSTAFMFIAVGFVSLSFFSTYVSVIDHVNSMGELRIELQDARESMRVVNEAMGKYTTCEMELASNFPGTDRPTEQAAAYDLEKAKCDSLQAEYEKTLDSLTR